MLNFIFFKLGNFFRGIHLNLSALKNFWLYLYLKGEIFFDEGYDTNDQVVEKKETWNKTYLIDDDSNVFSFLENFVSGVTSVVRVWKNYKSDIQLLNKVFILRRITWIFLSVITGLIIVESVRVMD